MFIMSTSRFPFEVYIKPAYPEILKNNFHEIK